MTNALLKMTVDYSAYLAIKPIAQQGDMSPSIIASAGILLEYILVSLVSLVISIVGLRYKNRHAKPALVMNIVVFVYLFIPAGIILGVFL